MKGHGDQGVSLIEIMVAVLVLSIAVVGLFRVFGAGAASASAEMDRELANLVARNRAEEIALGLAELPDRVELADRVWQITQLSTTTSGGFQRIAIRVSPASGGAGVELLIFAARVPP